MRLLVAWLIPNFYHIIAAMLLNKQSTDNLLKSLKHANYTSFNDSILKMQKIGKIVGGVY